MGRQLWLWAWRLLGLLSLCGPLAGEEKGAAVSSQLNASAFCQHLETLPPSHHFPLLPPEPHLPWVWDAVLSPAKREVRVVALSREPCHFNVTRWQEAVAVSNGSTLRALGYGLFSNILVAGDNVRGELTARRVFQQTYRCDFLRGAALLASSHAPPFRGNRAHVGLGAVVVRCPLPQTLALDAFDSLRLSYRDDDRDAQRWRTKHGHVIRFRSFATEAFPVCTLPAQPPSHASDNAKALTTQPFGVAICAATLGDHDRATLVEWLEYHFALGVDHVVVYVTATDAAPHAQLLRLLADYVAEQRVTLVPWPYENCVRGMASGRGITYEVPSGGGGNDSAAANATSEFFQPPRCIAQAAALASCYLRFQHTARYIAHVDVDEFLFLRAPSATFADGARLPVGVAAPRPFHLRDAADEIFALLPRFVAVSFYPILVDACARSPADATIGAASEATPPLLPTFVRATGGNVGRPFEAKLLLRTDAVVMFFVHYLLQVEAKRAHWLVYPAPVAQGGLWHVRSTAQTLFRPQNLSHCGAGRVPLRFVDANEQRLRHVSIADVVRQRDAVAEVQAQRRGEVADELLRGAGVAASLWRTMRRRFNRRMAVAVGL